jgi:hypothetical protein
MGIIWGYKHDIIYYLNLLKPTGYVMNQLVNIQ